MTVTVSPHAVELACAQDRRPRGVVDGQPGESRLRLVDCIFTTIVPVVEAGTVILYQSMSLEPIVTGVVEIQCRVA